MDDMTIDIDTLVLRGGLPADETSLAAMIGTQTGADLDAHTLAQVSRAVAESIHADAVGPGADPVR
ncbi:MAG: hypothetical protein ACRDRV_09460 [Pseudonocardiaceae bacterium]